MFEYDSLGTLSQFACYILLVIVLVGSTLTFRFVYRDAEIADARARDFFSKKDEAVKEVYRSKLSREDQEKAVLLIKQCRDEEDFNYLMTLILKDCKK